MPDPEHARIGLTLVAHYGDKPPAFAAWLRAVQARLAALGDAFQAYEPAQVHATVVGLEGLRVAGSPQLLGANFLELRQQRRPLQLARLRAQLAASARLPLSVQIGGFAPHQSYPFSSRGQHPYLRSFAFAGEQAVAMGWPSDGAGYPPALAALRLELEPLGALHKYHARRDAAGRPQTPDNDCFFVLGRLDRRNVASAQLAELERELRAFMAAHPLRLVIDSACLRVVRYQTPQLPVESSLAMPLDTVDAAADQWAQWLGR